MDAFIEWVKTQLLNLVGLDKILAGETTPLAILNLVTRCLTLVLGICVAYRFVYTIIGFFGKAPKYPEAPKTKRYCFIICARNEEKVIGNTVESVLKQNYPKELLDCIVLAHNCNEDDHTAEIARSKGAKVYECQQPNKRRKGWGLEYLFEQIEKDIGIDYYDAYLFLDADNVVDVNFTAKMNDAYSTGKFDVIYGYRNIKNFGDNIISSAYGFSFYRYILSCHRPRSILGSGTMAGGTGYLASAEVLKDGWHYYELLEDNEMVLKNTAKGYRFGYCEEAVTYDEQPTNFKISCRQRMRWIKGGFIVFFKYIWILIGSGFKKPSWTKYDIFWEQFPYSFITFIFGFSYPIAVLITALVQLATGASLSYADFEPVVSYVIGSFAGTCASCWLLSILCSIRERKNIRCSVPKLILYNLVWPWYDLISIPLALLSLFMHITWKPIPHKDARSIEDIEKENIVGK